MLGALASSRRSPARWMIMPRRKHQNNIESVMQRLGVLIVATAGAGT
jgi:hypothetical protein